MATVLVNVENSVKNVIHELKAVTTKHYKFNKIVYDVTIWHGLPDV